MLSLSMKSWLGAVSVVVVGMGCGSSSDDDVSNLSEGSADVVEDAGVADTTPEVFVEPLIVGEGQRCDAAALCGEPTICADGLECVTVGAGETPFCLRPCALEDADACGEGVLSCTSFEDEAEGGYCYLETADCVSDGDCDFGDRFEGYTCRDLPGGRTSCEPEFRTRFVIGDSCQPWGEDMCVPEICGTNAVCVEGACVGVVEVDAGSPCSLEFTDPLVNALVCGNANVCVAEGRDDGFGQCAARCDGSTACAEASEACLDREPESVCVVECAQSADCVMPRQTCEGGLCRSPAPLVREEAFAPCSGTANFLPEERYCRNDLTCYAARGGFAGICLDYCSVRANDCPLEGDACAQFSGNQGACLPTCTDDSECSLDSICTNFGATQHCRLSQPTGPRGLGEPCDDRMLEGLCEPEWLCLRGQDGETGACVAYCIIGEDECPSVADRQSECILNSADGSGACAWLCDRDADCPSLLGCRNGFCSGER
ncbi:MAG: hypothetical protein ACJA1R_001184 [Flavobacteriales bacterium]|jgi:hypothetical protein